MIDIHEEKPARSALLFLDRFDGGNTDDPAFR
jgi:hypothetical protein